MTLAACLDRHFAHAAMRLRLDEELGNWHGLSWDDYVLLAQLDARDGWETAQLAARLGRKSSALLLQLLPLEKTGLVARVVDPHGRRRIVLLAGGRRLVQEARATAEAACEAG